MNENEFMEMKRHLFLLNRIIIMILNRFTGKLQILFFNVRKRSCWKVMFLHLSVSHSVHRGGVYPSMQWAGGVS